MVRIVNGEIVRDDSPSAGGLAAVRQRAMGSLSSSSSSSSPQQSASCPAGARTGPPPAGHSRVGSSSGPAGPGLVEQLEQKLGIVGKTWATPEVPALHWRPLEIPLVNLVIAGAVALLLLFMGYSPARVGVFGILGLGLWIQMHSASSRPAERGHAASEQRRGTSGSASGR